MAKERVAVIGVGQTKYQATRGDVSVAGLVREAAVRALADAELTWADIDAVVIGKAPDFFEGVMMPELFLADALGATGKPHAAGAHRGLGRWLDGHRRREPRAVGHPQRADGLLREAVRERGHVGALAAHPLHPTAAAAGGYFAPHIRSYIRRSGAPDHIGMLVALKDRRTR